MKKINSLVLSTITAAFLVGCGGGGGSSSSGTDATPTTSGTNVTVERGAVFGATVTDANGQVATQKDSSNIYTFATPPKYPITASGGIIDVDGDGQVSEGDVELTTVLTSYSTVVTPITTYLGDTTTTEGTAKLAKLKEIAKVTNDDDLLKRVPSELNTDVDVIVLTNAIFHIMNDDNNSNDDFIKDYDNSEFKTKFDTLKVEADKYTDKKEKAKALEENVVSNLGLPKLPSDEVNNIANGTNKATTLKISDLTKFVSYEKGEYWYDENTLSGDKLSFKAWDYGFVDGDHAWILENEDEYVTITKDATSPYKLSYVDPITKEEGTFTILSTKKLTSYTDLYETKAQIVITKKATELEWDRWDWSEPSYWENNAEVKITDIDGLEKNYLLQNSVINLDNSEQVVIKDDYKVYLEQNETKAVGTWKKENGQIIVSVGKETKYLKVVSEDAKYFIEEATLEDVGSIDSETIYTGTSLEDFITDIKAPAPAFTSDTRTVADENQTGLFFSVDKTKAFQATVENNQSVTFSLSGTDAKSFNINSEGVVTFKIAPDFETKRYYDFNVVAKNKVGKKSWQNIQVKINDIEETVVIPTEPTPDVTIFSKTDLIGKKLVVSNETFFFEQDRVVLGDSGDDYTTTLTYSSVENNKIILSNGDILEKTADGYKITFESGKSNQEIFSALSLSTYTSDELNNALNDVSSTPADSITWYSWTDTNPEHRGEAITNLTLLTNSFTDEEYSNWFEAADSNGNDIEVTLATGGNVVNVSEHETNGGALHGSTVLGTWTTSNNMINITMNTGEKIYIRLNNNVIQTGYIELP